MSRLQGKVVLITGGASGVGRETARRVVEEGGRAVIADIDEAAGLAVVNEIGDAATFVSHDVSSEASWENLMSAVQTRFGKFDALVNSAAICRTESIEDTSLDMLRQTLRINLEGTFLGCKYGIARMKASGGGSIVNLSSTAAIAGHTGMAAYTASKGAVTALTRNVAAHCRSHGYRIRCNSILPAGIRTPMAVSILGNLDEQLTSFDQNPQSGFCEPSDVANVIVFLASDESRFINGAEMRVDNAFLVSLG